MRKGYLKLLICYLIWGFSPLYWELLSGMDPFTMLSIRIIFAAITSVVILAIKEKAKRIIEIFSSWKYMKCLLPAVVFLFLDWAGYIVGVRTEHVLDISLGYYLNPLFLFTIGSLVYKEKMTTGYIIAIIIATIGVVISAVSYGSIPLFALFIAINWAIYATIKKNVRIDGVLSIAVETIIMTPFALIFLLFFRTSELAAIEYSKYIYILGSGIVTALPMYLYSSCVSSMRLIVMCFATYLSPTFNLISGIIMGERFTGSQLISLIFFLMAIIVFTYTDLRRNGVITFRKRKKHEQTNEIKREE